MKLFSWFKSLFSKKAADPTEIPPLYAEEEQGIFAYFNGKEMVRADPMVLYRRLAAYGADLEIDLQVADSPMRDAPEALQKALKKIREAFDLPIPKNPLRAPDEGCLSEAGVIAVFNRFIVFCNDVKKNWNTSPTPAVDKSTGSSPSTAESPPTPNTSDSGSTAKELPTDSPTPSA